MCARNRHKAKGLAINYYEISRGTNNLQIYMELLEITMNRKYKDLLRSIKI